MRNLVVALLWGAALILSSIFSIVLLMYSWGKKSELYSTLLSLGTSVLLSAGVFALSCYFLYRLSIVGRPTEWRVPITREYLDIGNVVVAITMWIASIAIAPYSNIYPLAVPLVWVALIYGIKGRSLFTGDAERAFRREQWQTRYSNLLRARSASASYSEKRSTTSTVGIVGVGLGIAALVMPYMTATIFAPLALICAVLALREGDKKLGWIALLIAIVGLIGIADTSSSIQRLLQ